MTGTKVIKLKLEGSTADGMLPKLKDPVVEKALRLYDRIGYMEQGGFERVIYGEIGYHDTILEESGGWDLNSGQIQDVITALEHREFGTERHASKTGLFVNALMLGSKEKEFRISTFTPLDYLGFRWEEPKKLTVDGDLGDHIGKQMEVGEITVRGSIGDYGCKSMTGGEITVEGNAGSFTGDFTRGGILKVGGKIAGFADQYGWSGYFSQGEIWESGKKVRG
ncbi:MAG: hypothetical protein V1921_06435 [Candidatus Altiarchaeota archaeon]